ncbi:MAG TPA: phosphoribosyltransferase family protein, partial [Parvularculaceae bacterium]|nr:phosphoribosyltransferase family protein [Parvularculaceae bacterium]
MKRFLDRAEAGRLLADVVARLKLQDPIVYALPRGGVPVAVEVARALKAPLDLIFVRKLGAPGQAELAMGAVVDGLAPVTILNDDVVRALGVDDATIRAATRRALQE